MRGPLRERRQLDLKYHEIPNRTEIRIGATKTDAAGLLLRLLSVAARGTGSRLLWSIPSCWGKSVSDSSKHFLHSLLKLVGWAQRRGVMTS